MLQFVVIIFFFSSCDSDEDIETFDLTGSWKVISFDDYEASTKIYKSEDNTWTDFNNGNISVNFAKPNSNDHGVISGINVTNSFSGNYDMDKKGKISIGSFIMTFINEPEWARLFHSIQNAENYLVKDEYLIIFYNHKKNSITLKRNN